MYSLFLYQDDDSKGGWDDFVRTSRDLEELKVVGIETAKTLYRAGGHIVAGEPPEKIIARLDRTWIMRPDIEEKPVDPYYMAHPSEVPMDGTVLSWLGHGYYEYSWRPVEGE